jgi:hypothetical protein
VSLFLRIEPLLNLDTLVTGISPSESTWLWTVPDLLPDTTYRIMAIAYGRRVRAACGPEEGIDFCSDSREQGPAWQYDESDTCFWVRPAGVAEEERQRPAATQLTSVFPNPIGAYGNTPLRVQFDLAGQSRVKLTISDVTGRQVATLIDRVMPLGSHQASWNLTGIPSGIYFLSLSADRCRACRKLVVE